MTEKMRHLNLADNLKRILRDAAARYGQLPDSPGRMDTIYDFAAVPGESPKAELRTSAKLVIDLGVGDLVIIPDLKQFGIPFMAPDGRTGYTPFTAEKYVADITEDIIDENKAIEEIKPYFEAIQNLFK